MARAIQCDSCGAYLGGLDKNGEDDFGEVYAWIRLSTSDREPHMDACTVSCAHKLLDGTFGDRTTKSLLAVAEVSRVIREAREAPDDDDEADQ